MDLNIKQNYKTFRERKEKMFGIVVWTKSSWTSYPKAPSIKDKLAQWNLIKTEALCSVESLVKQMQRQATDREKASANHII